MKADGTATMESLLLQAGWLRRFALALVKDQDLAEDIVQETLVTAWQRPAENAGRAWLATIVRNLAITHWRGSVRRERRELDGMAHGAGRVATPEDLVGDAQIHRVVAEVVAGLDEPFRQTLVLRFFDGHSCADIARRLRVPHGTIRWRLKEGIDRVRRQLDARYGQDRKSWVAALLPMLPQSVATTPSAKGWPSAPPMGTGRFSVYRAILVAAAAATIVAVTALGFATRRLPNSTLTSSSTATVANEPAGGWVLQGAQSPVRLNLQALASSPGEGADKAVSGPGQGDATSLVAELLAAIVANAYDDFLAKGSAGLKAALSPARLQAANAHLAGRLGQPYQTSLLGHVRRGEVTDWLFKLEFADSGDDALVTMAMQGWQVAGFLVDASLPNPTEN